VLNIRDMFPPLVSGLMRVILAKQNYGDETIWHNVVHTQPNHAT
jgi:hypothetical protein